MAERHQKIRHAARVRKLLDVAIEMKNVQAGIALSRQIMQLYGWLPTPTKAEDEPEAPAPAATDMSHLLASINGSTT
jgi:hypothetical protein